MFIVDMLGFCLNLYINFSDFFFFFFPNIGLLVRKIVQNLGPR